MILVDRKPKYYGKYSTNSFFSPTNRLRFRWIAKYIDEPKQSLLKTLLDRQGSKDGLRLSYKIYDWMLNQHDDPIPNIDASTTWELN